MPCLSKSDHGIILTVKVVPRAAREGLAGVEAGALKVRLNAPPVEGAANRALIKLLAKLLGVAKGRLSLVSGERSRNKKVEIQGLDLARARERLGL